MNLADVVALVEEKADGRSLAAAKHRRWAQLVRQEASRDAIVSGFKGLYFLYREATVTGGSVAGQSRYAMPTDYIDDMAVWHDGTLMVKADAGVMDVSRAGIDALGGKPCWVAIRGQELEFLPPTDEDGKEIKLFYNALPLEINAASPDDFSDYFLEAWTNLHVYGMAEYALDSVGAFQAARGFRERFREELSRLRLHNRQFWTRGMKLRFQNWDEFSEQKALVFPQFRR